MVYMVVSARNVTNAQLRDKRMELAVSVLLGDRHCIVKELGLVRRV
jgi:hypothetical protein